MVPIEMVHSCENMTVSCGGHSSHGLAGSSLGPVRQQHAKRCLQLRYGVVNILEPEAQAASVVNFPLSLRHTPSGTLAYARVPGQSGLLYATTCLRLLTACLASFSPSMIALRRSMCCSGMLTLPLPPPPPPPPERAAGPAEPPLLTGLGAGW